MDELHIIISLLLIGYLLSASYSDIKTQTISLKLSLIALIPCILIRIILCNYDIKAILLWLLCGCIAGIILLLLAFITRESIGYGDGFALIIIGIGTGLKCAFLTCAIAFVLAAIVACVLLIGKTKKKTIPFLPFLCTGYILQFFLS